ncbi:MAG: beta-propeller domain-containing protein [Candidatus Bathyarchaeaceae archaeon]
MKKSFLSLILILAIVCAIVPFYLDKTETIEHTQLRKFSSYEELKTFLKTQDHERDWLGTPKGIPVLSSREAMAITESTPDFSTTNIQVAGVDEADIVKTDGTYLYVVAGTNIFILKAYPPEEAQILSQISFDATPWQLFINEDKLAVLGGATAYTYRTATFIDDKTFVKVYDVSDRANPALTRNFSISGNYFNSRMIGKYVYVVISQPAYLIYDTLVLPKIYTEEGIKEIGASQIYYAQVSDYNYAFTTIAAINIQDDEQEATHKTFLLGATSCLYASLNNIYITFWKHEKTLIYRIRIREEKIEHEADGEIPGSVLNQFSMDEYNSHFRIATTTRLNGTSQNNLYVLDASLRIVGKLENIAPRETIYSARFMGDRCYLVTFRQVDPFFVIDLKDPSNPKILGQLKIPGFSSYLHPYDENHVIGIGKEGMNVKISLFDVSNVNDPKEVGKYLVEGEWSDTLVLTDHKAFLFDKSKNLLVIPISITKMGIYKDSMWQGAYVFDITLDRDPVLKGGITHLENTGDPWLMEGWVKRSLYIDNVLYTISDKKVKMNNLTTLDEINEVEFP